MADREKKEGELLFQYKDKTRKLSTRQWVPQGEIRALAFICHGYGERLEPYYDGVCQAGTGEGVLCFGHDHTGHGLSEGERVQVESEDEYVLPVLQHCTALKSQYPNLPLFIIGHSMGGLITVLTALMDAKQEKMIKGIVLVGPLIEADPEVATPFKIMLARLLSGVLPGFQLGALNREHITSDKEWLEIIRNDKLRWHGKFKALHSYVLLNRLQELPKELANLTTPLYILHGEKDAICTPSGSNDLFQAAATSDKEIKIVEGAMHNLLVEREPIRSQTFADIWAWVTART